MEINPASLPHVQKGRRGRVVFIDNDALDVSKQLEAMQFPEGYGSLKLAWHELNEEFVVIQLHPQKGELMVTTAKKADQRLVDRVRQVTSPSYNLAEELEKIDQQADHEHGYLFNEVVGEISERVAHAIRKDVGLLRTDINRQRVWREKT